jgi:hypothetical protein
MTFMSGSTRIAGVPESRGHPSRYGVMELIYDYGSYHYRHGIVVAD